MVFVTAPIVEPALKALTVEEHRLVHRAFDAILATAPACPNCGKPARTAITGDESEGGAP